MTGHTQLGDSSGDQVQYARIRYGMQDCLSGPVIEEKCRLRLVDNLIHGVVVQMHYHIKERLSNKGDTLIRLVGVQ